MSVSTVKPWTMAEFFAWGAAQEGRYEFDGVRPVAMTGGSARHDRIAGNIRFSLTLRLRDTPCLVHGPDLGINTMGAKVRYPDALVICSKFPETDRLAHNPLVVFEVLSPDSSRRDRIEKLHEYAAVPSILHYVIVDSASVDVTSFRRNGGDAYFQSEPPAVDGVLCLAALDLEIPLDEIYARVDFGIERESPDAPAGRPR